MVEIRLVGQRNTNETATYEGSADLRDLCKRGISEFADMVRIY